MIDHSRDRSVSGCCVMNSYGREPAHAEGNVMLDLREVSAHYAGRCALEGVSLRLATGERIAVVGPNGAGKSTLFKVIAEIGRAHV